MAPTGTKRRSTRQAVSRNSKRSIYAEPETDEDEFDVDVDGEEEYAPEPIAEEPPPRQQRRKPAPRTRHQTRSKSVGKSKAVAKPRLKGIGKKRRWNTLSDPLAKGWKEFKGQSDGRIPKWTSLPIDILREVFVFASQPLHEQTRTASANVDWLIKTARVCRAFAVPALEAYYQSPSLLTSYAPHQLHALLQKDEQYMHYNVKVKSLSIDVRRLAYSATNMGLFDITHFAETLPQLQHAEILHPIDEPPFRTPGKIQNWYYPERFFSTLEERGNRLKSWRWNRNMIQHVDAASAYTSIAQTHTGKSFEYLERLTVCDFGYDNSAEPIASQDGVEATAPGLASSISLLPRLKDLTLISCEVLVDKFLERLPKDLERLEITNCLELTSDMLQTYLVSGGSQLRELVLNHNPALNMSFLTGLERDCSRLEVLKMDLRYYSERLNSNDAQALYDELLTADNIPTWPTTLRHLELIHLQRWAAEAAQNLFRSLVEGAAHLPDLRHLVLHSHLSIPWRQRAEFRDQWIDRLQRVYARRSKPPNPHLGSLKQFRMWKLAQADGWDFKDSGRARTHGDESDDEFSLGRRISHVAISPARPRGADVEVYSDASPEKKTKADQDVGVRRSRRVAEASQTPVSGSPPAGGAVDNTSNDEDDEGVEEGWEGQEETFVQGLCTVVDIRIDNQRLREDQFTEGDFLDSERSGDEDWHEGDEDGSDDGVYACTSDQYRRYASSHHPHAEPTIYALSTAPGRAAIAVIRISGPACLDVYRALCPGKKDPKPRYATVRTLYESSRPLPQSSVRPAQVSTIPPPANQVLDPNALILYFPAPRTATGENVLELHLHGGPAVVKAVLSAIPRCEPPTTTPGAPRIRYAEPGEFTRRAFLNERLDLTQVEALGDVLAATTEQQRRLSVRGTTGGLAKRYEAWRQQLLYARGELEALIDFSEDQHFDESPSELCASVAGQVRGLRGVLDVHRRNAVRGEMLRSGIGIALLGSPNAGKSSLLNGIVGREAAIVSREAGTTRDVVEIGIDLGGYLCRVGDTAGLRSVDEGVRGAGGEVSGGISLVEQEGMRRAKARAAESDVVLLVLSLEDVDADGSVSVLLDSETVDAAAELIRTKGNVLVVLNKTDKAFPPDLETATQQILQTFPGLTKTRIYPISCKTASEASTSTITTTTDAGGIQTLLQGLIAHFHTLTTALNPATASENPEPNPDAVIDPSIWQDSLGATERHRLLLEDCIRYLDAFLAEVYVPTSDERDVDSSESGGDEDGEADIVLAAEHLRGAGECLARITGRGGAGDVEEVLGVVFEKFCVGK
ncbi:hypothetical protein LTR35_012411 [Friedmanniomyces endolithicus]|nr:hypothetical protein LTS00_017162 [Friedmanniomyces endolithicus]KAK0273339.1 hypothetical protein LTR35_012411 [Friedmanniomyces endolithicus]KAK1015291.1 hypothetical protein LTR54_003834 [Friedmanniomyces endolithicus]